MPDLPEELYVAEEEVVCRSRIPLKLRCHTEKSYETGESFFEEFDYKDTFTVGEIVIYEEFEY